MYSEKATKFCEIFLLLLPYVVPVKNKRKILQNFVAFSKYMNFIMKDTLLKRLFLVLIKENDNMKNIYPDIQNIKILLHTAVIR